MAADEFLSRKKCNKTGYRSSQDIIGNFVVTSDDVNIEVGVGSNGGTDEVGEKRDKGNADKDTDEVNEDEDRSEVNADEETEAIAH